MKNNTLHWLLRYWHIIIVICGMLISVGVAQERINKAERDILTIKQDSETRIMRLEEKIQRDSEVLSEVNKRLSSTEGKLDIIIRMLEKLN
jgi:hypothetical protein